MTLNQYGSIAESEWEISNSIREEIHLDEFIIMPNHIHGIVMIRDAGATGRSPVLVDVSGSIPPRGPKKKSLGSFIAGYKSAVSKKINEIRKMPGKSVWHRNYFEHIIRGESDLKRIRRYILDNPMNWQNDEYFR